MPLHRSMTFRVIRTVTLADGRPDTDAARGADDHGPEGRGAAAEARVFRLHGPAARLELPPGPARPMASPRLLGRRSRRLVRGG
jgi:hypothetical protein